jgi:hypothetical protein
MGYLLSAICNKCGFSRKNFGFGSGMIRRTALVPAIRKDTGEFVVEEISDDPNLRFYHQREMYKDPVIEFGIQNEDISLNPTGNLCPSCQEYMMEFEVCGGFD